MAQDIATVIGGTGFVGRAVVARLVKEGYHVRVGSRRPDRAGRVRRLGAPGKVVPVYAAVDDGPTLDAAFEGATVGINLVSILAEQGQATFKAINADGAARCARHAAKAGISRYVQVSAIGASPESPSAYGRTKADGERLTRQYIPEAAIIRPSVIFGPGDKFLNMFALMTRFAPIIPVFCGNTRFQPVFVDDVAAAIVALAAAPEGRTVEAGGPDVISMTGLIEFILAETGRHRPLFQVPMALATLQAEILQRLPGKLFTRDQLSMLSRDNVVEPGAMTLSDLGITPKAMRDIAPGYLK
jgi:uncharacterized protein YbjT (DUF2867 family)